MEHVLSQEDNIHHMIELHQAQSIIEDQQMIQPDLIREEAPISRRSIRYQRHENKEVRFGNLTSFLDSFPKRKRFSPRLWDNPPSSSHLKAFHLSQKLHHPNNHFHSSLTHQPLAKCNHQDNHLGK